MRYWSNFGRCRKIRSLTTGKEQRCKGRFQGFRDFWLSFAGRKISSCSSRYFRFQIAIHSKWEPEQKVSLDNRESTANSKYRMLYETVFCTNNITAHSPFTPVPRVDILDFVGGAGVWLHFPCNRSATNCTHHGAFQIRRQLSSPPGISAYRLQHSG